jgi:FKBP-type peptidyl-prolyl cis-trans isomerase FklB
MKIIKLILPVIIFPLLSTILTAQEPSDLTDNLSKLPLKTREDSLSYALALMNYSSLAKENVSINPLIFAKAMIEAKKGSPVLSEESARNILMAYVNERQARQAELERAASKDYIDANEAFLAKNKEKPGVNVTPSGLQYEVVTMGTGPKPTSDNVVKVNYAGKLIDGTEFDSSYKRNAPAQFPLGGVIPGWTEGLQLMPVGSKFIFYIPEKLGYGSRGAGDAIKPFSTLIFEVELLEIVQ